MRQSLTLFFVFDRRCVAEHTAGRKNRKPLDRKGPGNMGTGESDQCSIPNSQFSSEKKFKFQGSPRMGIENWELSIGQISPVPSRFRSLPVAFIVSPVAGGT